MEKPYECKLSKEAIAKAGVELNEPEDNNAKREAIAKLKNSFKAENPNLKLLREDDKFLLRFLRAKKFNDKKALQVLTNYHNRREEWPEVFDKVKNPVLLRNVFEKGFICPLEKKANNGSVTILMRSGIHGCTVLTDLFAAMILTIEEVLDDEEAQVFGVTLLLDLAYFTAEMATQMTPLLARRYATTILGCLPIRIKQVNMTNEPTVFGILFALFQPFITSKLNMRIQFHGTDFTKLYEFIDRSALPFMFAGTGPDVDILAWTSTILGEGTAL